MTHKGGCDPFLHPQVWFFDTLHDRNEIFPVIFYFFAVFWQKLRWKELTFYAIICKLILY